MRCLIGYVVEDSLLSQINKNFKISVKLNIFTQKVKNKKFLMFKKQNQHIDTTFFNIYIYIYNIGNIYLFWIEFFYISYVDLSLELKYTKEV